MTVSNHERLNAASERLRAIHDYDMIEIVSTDSLADGLVKAMENALNFLAALAEDGERTERAV